MAVRLQWRLPCWIMGGVMGGTPKLRLEHSYCVVEKGLSPALCAKIVETGEAAESMDAQVIRDPKNNVRNSTVSWIGYGDETMWLYDAVTQIVRETNERLWRWTLSGPESMQYTRYGEEQYYTWHADQRRKPYPPEDRRWPGLTRKLSVVVSLSGADDYEGGDFMLETMDAPPLASEQRLKTLRELRNMGNVLIFPSFLYHQVTAVTAGYRRSLVAWFLGPPFV